MALQSSPVFQTILNSPPWGGLFICTYASKRQKATTHATEWGRTDDVPLKKYEYELQLTPHVGANPETAPPVQEDYELQLTPRVGANRQRMPCRFPRRASTHAPVWGRTGSEVPLDA